MKDAKFISYFGSTVPRMFLHHAAWAAGEVRRVTEQDAADLDAHFPGSFTFKTPKAPIPKTRKTKTPKTTTTTPADPAKE